MASPQHPAATLEKLPNDVLSNIFIRLRAKQLPQMRCVSKPWNALLSRPSFVKSHLQLSIHNNDKIMLVFYEGHSFLSKPFTAHRSQSPKHELIGFIKLPATDSQSELYEGRIVGSVNGLICYFYETAYDPIVHIWNPSLSALLTLPPCSIRARCYPSIEFFFRFGFDPKTDDYHVVKLTQLTPKKWLQVQVYSMRKGSWDLISQPFPSHIDITHSREVCVDGNDGHVHWLGYFDADDELSLPIIVAFDLGVQTFCEIALPVSIRDKDVYSRSNVIGFMSGKLCVMSSAGDGECEIWVIDEYSVAESWVKHHMFTYFTGKITPYGFTSHGEFLFEAVKVNEVDEDHYETYLALSDLIVGKYHFNPMWFQCLFF